MIETQRLSLEQQRAEISELVMKRVGVSYDSLLQTYLEKHKGEGYQELDLIAEIFELGEQMVGNKTEREEIIAAGAAFIANQLDLLDEIAKGSLFKRATLESLASQVKTGGHGKEALDGGSGPYWPKKEWEAYYQRTLKQLVEISSLSPSEAEDAMRELSKGVIIVNARPQ